MGIFLVDIGGYFFLKRGLYLFFSSTGFVSAFVFLILQRISIFYSRDSYFCFCISIFEMGFAFFVFL